MKKKVFGRQLSRERDTRRALYRSLTRALVLSGKIKTTRAKAKSIQGYIDRLITLGKSESLSSRRKLYSILGNDRLVTDFLVEKVAPKFSGRKSGYTRIINLPRRTGDNAQIVSLEWTEEVEKYVKPTKEKTKKVKKAGKKASKNNLGDKKGSGDKTKTDKKTKTRGTLKKVLGKKK